MFYVKAEMENESSSVIQETKDKREKAVRPKRWAFYVTKTSSKIIIVLIVICFIFTTIAAISINKEVKATSRAVNFGFANIGELATQVGYFTSVQVIDKSREVLGITVPFTESKYAFDGGAKFGFVTNLFKESFIFLTSNSIPTSLLQY